MASDYPVRDPDRAPTHPGALVREDVLPAIGKAKAEIARLLGISRQTLYGILSEEAPVTPDMAVRFGKLFGNGPGVWLRMQTAYDLWHAKRRVDVSAIPTLRTTESPGRPESRSGMMVNNSDETIIVQTPDAEGIRCLATRTDVDLWGDCSKPVKINGMGDDQWWWVNEITPFAMGQISPSDTTIVTVSKAWSDASKRKAAR